MARRYSARATVGVFADASSAALSSDVGSLAGAVPSVIGAALPGVGGRSGDSAPASASGLAERAILRAMLRKGRASRRATSTTTAVVNTARLTLRAWRRRCASLRASSAGVRSRSSGSCLSILSLRKRERARYTEGASGAINTALDRNRPSDDGADEPRGPPGLPGTGARQMVPACWDCCRGRRLRRRHRHRHRPH